MGTTTRAGAVTIGARARDDVALPVARPAGLRDREESLLEADLPRATALLASRRAGTRFGTGSPAGRARRHARDGERLLAPERRFLERHVQLVLEVLTPTRARPSAATSGPEEIAEEIADDVLEPGAEIEATEAPLLE